MLTNFNSHQNFNGFLHIQLKNPEKAGLPEKYQDPFDPYIVKTVCNSKGKVISQKRIPEVVINTDAIQRIECEHRDLMVQGPYYNTIVYMPDNIRYELKDVNLANFNEELVAAAHSKSSLVDFTI